MDQQGKPRLNYAAIFSKPAKPQYAEGSFASLIQKYIDDRDALGARGLGLSHRYTLRRLQRSDIGAKAFAALRPIDFMTHCKQRRAAGVLPQTIQQDMTYASGVLKYAAEMLELPGAEAVLDAFKKKAKPQLLREQLIAKSTPRDRRPTQEELDLILADLSLPPKKANNKIIPMVPIVKFSYLSARRISETCRLRWADVNMEKRTCLVRDLKNPKGKGFHDEFPLLGEAWDIVMAQPRTGELIFPYNPKSCGAKYTRVKAVLAKRHPGKFLNLRLHDNRRECISRLFEQGFNVPEVARVSLHRNPTQLLGTYTRLKAEDLHKGPAAKRTAP